MGYLLLHRSEASVPPSERPPEGPAISGNASINYLSLAASNVMAEVSLQAWLLVTRRGMWAQFLSDRRWAFHRHSMPRARELARGDLGIVYLTKEGAHSPSRLAAVVRVSAPGQMGEEQEGSDFYPYKVPFEVLAELEPNVEFTALVPRLEFITSKQRYGVFLQGKSAMRLSGGDTRVVLEAALGAAHGQGKRNLRSLI